MLPMLLPAAGIAAGAAGASSLGGLSLASLLPYIGLGLKGVGLLSSAFRSPSAPALQGIPVQPPGVATAGPTTGNLAYTAPILADLITSFLKTQRTQQPPTIHAFAKQLLNLDDLTRPYEGLGQ